MRKYCKAYHLRDLRQYSKWSDPLEGSELSDDAVVYLWDDFIVVRSPIVSSEGILWDVVTPEWIEFCQSKLQFEIPQDLRLTYEQAQEEPSL